jgi:N-acetylmuramoyl-L-alanine amidase
VVFKYATRQEWKPEAKISNKPIYILQNSKAAAIFVELGDIKNKSQIQFIGDDKKLEEWCASFLQGIVAAHQQ